MDVRNKIRSEIINALGGQGAGAFKNFGKYGPSKIEEKLDPTGLWGPISTLTDLQDAADFKKNYNMYIEAAVDAVIAVASGKGGDLWVASCHGRILHKKMADIIMNARELHLEYVLFSTFTTKNFFFKICIIEAI
jgi:hypothetical protein